MLKNLNKLANSRTKSKIFKSLIIWPIFVRPVQKTKTKKSHASVPLTTQEPSNIIPLLLSSSSGWSSLESGQYNQQVSTATSYSLRQIFHLKAAEIAFPPSFKRRGWNHRDLRSSKDIMQRIHNRRRKSMSSSRNDTLKTYSEELETRWWPLSSDIFLLNILIWGPPVKTKCRLSFYDYFRSHVIQKFSDYGSMHQLIIHTNCRNQSAITMSTITTGTIRTVYSVFI
jgi:hypothetical protein